MEGERLTLRVNTTSEDTWFKDKSITYKEIFGWNGEGQREIAGSGHDCWGC